MIHTIKSLGYESEAHVVETQDGYILRLFRIPSNKSGVKGVQPVFLQHGILSSCGDWVDAGERSLAFHLADRGYDVWFGNARGNTFSRKHSVLSERDGKFWNFSFHEMGLYDIPATLKYIGKMSKHGQDLIYIGHSMGTTMFFVFASLLPNIAKNVKAMVALAPVAYLREVKSPIKYLAPFTTEVELVTKAMGLNEFFPKNKIFKYLCYDSDMMNINKKICESVMFAISGFDKDQFDDKLLPAILSNKPAGTSTKTVIHYAQIIKNNGEFQYYDYGHDFNKTLYGSVNPPIYNVANIKVPMMLVYGRNDWLATPTDVQELASKMTNSPEVYEVPYRYFNHIDFLWAKDTFKLVYQPLFNFISKYGIK